MGFFYNGGGERTVLNQAHTLQEMGHQVKVYAPTVDNDCFSDLQKGLEIIELNHWMPRDFPYRNAVGMVISSLKIPYNELRKNHILIAHAQPSNWIAYALKKKYNTPYIAYLHQVNRFFKPREIDLNSGWDTNEDIALLRLIHKGNIGIKKLDTVSVTQSNKICTNSKWIRNQIQEYYGKNPSVVYPGVNTKKFEYKQNRNENIILSTNRHYPQKRIDYVIKCLKKIHEHDDNIKCIITGGFTRHTQELVELRNKLKLTEHITFTGNIDTNKLVKLYKNANTYAYTSPEEDFGLGPIESGACGTPSIVWDHAGPKETVINGVTGYRIRPYDIDAMAKYHLSIIENDELRINLGKNATEYVNKKFTWKNHCNKLQQHIKEII